LAVIYTLSSMICTGLDLKYWEFVKHELDRALTSEYNRITIDDVYVMIQNKDAQLWALHNGITKAVMVTQIVEYKRLKAVKIWLVTGTELDTWLDTLIETVSAWGKENGCSVMEFTGRKGWEKVLNKKGFNDSKISMTKPL